MNATLISPLYPLRGGIAESGTLLRNAFTKSGSLVGRINYKRMYPKFLFPGKSEFVKDVKLPKDLWFIEGFYRCNLDVLNPLTWFKVARSIKTDIVIIRYWTPTLALCIGTLAWLLRKKKIIFIVDNVIPHEKFPFSKLLTKYALRQGNRFIFFSDYVRNDFFRLFEDWGVTYNLHWPRVVSMPLINVSEKPIPKEEARKILHIDDRDKVILFFGLIRKYKGLETLIRAMPDILKEFPIEGRLLVVGEFYDDVEKYLNLVSELNLLNRVAIVNKYVEKVAPYFCAADVVVLPYKSATQSAVVRLAQYFKKPCIVTDVGGLREMVTAKTGFVVEEEYLASAVIDFFRMERKWDFSDIPTWDNVVEAIEELI